MTPRTTERTRLGEDTGGDEKPLSWTDVLRLYLALANENRELQDGIEDWAEDSPDELRLLGRVTVRWARDWHVVDHHLSKAIEKDAALLEMTPLLSKAFALVEGFVNALKEAHSRGITQVIEEGAAEDTWWWITDLRRKELEMALIIVQEAKRDDSAGELEDDHAPSDLRDFMGAFRDLDDIATGTDPEHFACSTTKLRAFLFASWVRARAIHFAEFRLLRTLHRYPDECSL